MHVISCKEQYFELREVLNKSKKQKHLSKEVIETVFIVFTLFLYPNILTVIRFISDTDPLVLLLSYVDPPVILR
jgi:hypothetical protein